jgi:hypothetical protein
MSRAEQIRDIVESRRKLAKNVSNVSQTLKSIELLLNSLRQQKLEISCTPFAGEIAIRVAKVDFDNIYQRVVQERRTLDILANKLDQRKLNIGVIGRGRQGKSFLLQKLTNLSPAEIPDGNADFCTGALSRICHQPNKQEAEADIHRYSEVEFLEEVIAPYYKRLNLGEPPNTLRSFQQNLPQLPKELQADPNFEEYRLLYKQFYNEYCLNFSSYEQCFDERLIPGIKREHIKNYVIQQRDESGNRVDFENLTVRKVEITCSFGDDDIGDIAFIDLPGLGDAKRGFLDLDRLVKAVRQDVDFVLFVCLPDMGNWREEEVNLYKSARDAFGDFPIADNSFMVLNHYRDRKNFEHCERFAKSLDSEQINVAKCVIVDFANRDEVNNLLLIPLLDYLSKNIEFLSKKYVETRQKSINKIRNDLDFILNDCSIPETDDDIANFVDLRNSLWREIKISLQNKCAEFEQSQNKIDEDFAEQTSKAIEKCRKDANAIPSVSQIREERGFIGCYKMAYYHYLLKIRKDFSEYFANLDEGLKAKLDCAKSEIAQVLAFKGKLLGLAPSKEGIELLEEITNEFASLGENAKDLHQAFRDFLGQYVALDNFIIRSKLQVHLDRLNPDATPDPLSQQVTAYQAITFCLESFDKLEVEISDKIETSMFGDKALKLLASKLISSFFKEISSGKTNMANESTIFKSDSLVEEQLQKSLENLRTLVINDCEETLKEMSNEPNRLAYAMVREFTENVTKKDLEPQWEKFLLRNRTKIWEEFKATKEREKIRQIWSDLIDQTKNKVNHPNAFQIFN